MVFMDMNAISWIESRHNQYAHRHVLQDESWGEYQVTQVVLDEYNTHHGTEYQSKDLYNRNIGFKIAHWYMDIRIPRLLRHYGIQDTIDNRLICWNGGIRAAIHHHLSRITQRYIKQYHAMEVI